jgi:hypothetical protein
MYFRTITHLNLTTGIFQNLYRARGIDEIIKFIVNLTIDMKLKFAPLFYNSTLYVYDFGRTYISTRFMNGPILQRFTTKSSHMCTSYRTPLALPKCRSILIHFFPLGRVHFDKRVHWTKPENLVTGAEQVSGQANLYTILSSLWKIFRTSKFIHDFLFLIGWCTGGLTSCEVMEKELKVKFSHLTTL